MEFKDKIILITGASSGIGRAAALAFSKEGGTIVVSDINEQGGRETVEMIKSESGEATFIKTNVAEYKEVESLMNSIIDQYGKLDIALNNAGIGGPIARFRSQLLPSSIFYEY